MFKKKPTVKALAPIRSSDRRKTADQIIKDHGLGIDVSDTATDDEKAAATAKHTQLRNSLLPDNVQAGRFTTTHGPNLKPVSGTLYVGSHAGQESRVLWFELEKRLYPTVYTLWQNPGLVPLLHTPEMMVEKLQGGANLMTPGLAGPPFPKGATTGATVAIASLDAPSVPVAIGTCAIDIAALTSTRGAKGHAVETLHWCGDEVWSYSTTGKPGRQAPAELEGWLAAEIDEDDLVEATDALTVEDAEEGGVSLAPTADADATESAAPSPESPVEAVEADAKPPPLSIKQIDEAFRRAFLFGIYQQMSSHSSQPNYGLDFPLNQSFVMSTLIQPLLPIFTPEDSKQLQIKNSSFKGLKKFLKALDKERLIKTKEKPSETLIMDVDFTDTAFADFKPYRLPKKDTTAGTAQGRSATAVTTSSDSDPSIGQQLTLQTLYKTPSTLSDLFSPSQFEQLLPAHELKAAVAAYIESHNLTSPKNKRLVTLDPFLADMFSSGSTLDTQVRKQGCVARDALADRCLASCTAQWVLIRKPADGSAPVTTKPRTGAAPKIKVTLETRSGNKTVTKISGMERFGIAPTALAEELRKTCAGATSVEPLVGASPKEGLSEVMVQGPQAGAVQKALERRGVKAQWLEVVDKVKKKK